MENIIFTTLDDIPPLRQCLFVPIDLQREFCDPRYDDDPRGNDATVAVCEKVNVLSPEFNRLSVRSCWVYYVDPRHTPDPRWACGGFYKVQPAAGDLMVHKKHNSAFKPAPSPLATLLEKEGVTTLMVAGVNLTSCVKDTVIGALDHGYDVILVSDLCANDNACYGDMAYFRQKLGDFFKQKAAQQTGQNTGRITYTNSGALLTMLEQRNAMGAPAVEGHKTPSLTGHRPPTYV